MCEREVVSGIRASGSEYSECVRGIVVRACCVFMSHEKLMLLQQVHKHMLRDTNMCMYIV